MTDHPILFSAPMVRAILEGRKTMTRRILKPQPNMLNGGKPLNNGRGSYSVEAGWKRYPYDVGDRLWLKHSADCFDVYWKPIPGWEGLYAAGTDGNIYRVDRGEPQMLKGSPSSRGYLTVSLSASERHTMFIHRLVCEAFYGPPPGANAQIRHLDGNRVNNHPSNLDWGDQGSNWQDRKAHGGGMGADHHSAKLSDSDVAAIRASSLSQRKLAAQYGVTQSSIWEIRKGLSRVTGHVPAERNMPAFTLWRSPLFCPRWASRITLEVTGVKVERLQDISEEDAKAEGVERLKSGRGYYSASQGKAAVHFGVYHDYAKEAFEDLWTTIHGPGAWEANPWVVAITFKRMESDNG